MSPIPTSVLHNPHGHRLQPAGRQRVDSRDARAILIEAAQEKRLRKANRGPGFSKGMR